MTVDLTPELAKDFRLAETILFGKYPIGKHEVFLWSDKSMAIVNYKPLVRHHVLVCPRRVEPRFLGLSDEEQEDLWLMARLVAKIVKKIVQKPVSFSIQEGEPAGQTVDHVHIHVIPETSEKVFKPDAERTWVDVFLFMQRENQGRHAG